jgi:preprotein translocase subunit SecF
MRFLRKLYTFDDDLDFRKGWRIAIVLSLLFILVSIGFLASRGLQLGIDFKGGTSFQFPANGTSVQTVRNALEPLGEGDAQIQTLSGGGSTGEELRIEVRAQSGTPDGAAKVTKTAEVLSTATKNPLDVINQNKSEVSPSWGHDVSDKALRALILFFIAIAIYITIRLEWKFAVGAIVSVLHDIVVSVGAYAIFRFEVTPGTVIAFLTILGYSLYDTIVVYDKLKANQAKVTPNGDMTYTDMMNLSLNQTFMRSLNTTLSAVLPVLAILFIGAGLLGAVTLEEFGLALLIGLISGAYSSVFIASPIVAWLKEREPRNTAIRERLERERGGRGRRAAVVTESGESELETEGEEAAEAVDSDTLVKQTASSERAPRDAVARASSNGGAPRASSPYSPNHPPRPRKKGKKR